MVAKEEIKAGDRVVPTNTAVKDSPDLQALWTGLIVKKIEPGGIAVVEHTTVHRIHVSRLTKGPDAYDPVV